jgi:hypothetical protein
MSLVHAFTLVYCRPASVGASGDELQIARHQLKQIACKYDILVNVSTSKIRLMGMCRIKMEIYRRVVGRLSI